ncbi:unnamed protein product [Acanthoscelides obtectus]|uniref:Gag protein n=1 Tax=Acanthoscelides obtectus TaxID=200917 RepID=A0A9P0Q614_ACAOB|nr:unnamed protein product [Acanthoscelides obtectus]CAK1681744.1 hypothetical protein AOBTE_LOCUS33258 [Acanthoscelides obtectus]
MITTAENVDYHAVTETTTATSVSDPATTPAITQSLTTPGVTTGAAGTSETSTAGTSAAMKSDAVIDQLTDLNYYLKKVAIGENNDMSQIENYAGGPDFEMFLDAVENVGILNGWNESQVIRAIELKLQSKARECYDALLPSERPRTMYQMREWFRKVFGVRVTVTAGKQELERCIRNPGETL